MRSFALLLALLLAAAPPAGPQDSGGLRADLLARINDARDARGLAPLRLDEILTRVAQERAEAMARSGSVDPGEGSVVAVSRRLRSQGYEAHAWTESALSGDGDLLSGWQERRAAAYSQAVFGDYEELGIGRAELRETPLLTLLFALPRRTYERRLAAPLSDLGAVRGALLAAVNRERQDAGRGPFEADPALDRLAQLQAEDMLDRGYYGHQDLEGQGPAERLTAAGYRWRAVGENIAKGIFSPEVALERWMASSGHRRNLLAREFSRLGTGVAWGDGPLGFEALWVQLFAAPP